MPGRRYPRTPPETAQDQHSRAAFKGGLDGYAHIPKPVGEELPAGLSRTGTAPPLLFYQDSFPGTGQRRDFPLTYRPLPYSERVFVDGMYQREGAAAAWSRTDAGSVLPGAAIIGLTSPPAPGQRVDGAWPSYSGDLQAESSTTTDGLTLDTDVPWCYWPGSP